MAGRRVHASPVPATYAELAPSEAQLAAAGPGRRLRDGTRAAACAHPGDDVEHAQGGQMVEAFLIPDAVEVLPQGGAVCRLPRIEGCRAHVIPPALIPVRRRPPE